MSELESKTGATSSGPMASSDWEAEYKAHIAAVILKAITQEGSIETYTAFRQVTVITGRTLSTVKNWLAYQSNLPDLASMARICEHWKIAPEAVLPPKLLVKLSEGASAVSSRAPVEEELSSVEIIPIRSSDSPANRQALLLYSKNPEKALFIRQEDSDNEQLRLVSWP